MSVLAAAATVLLAQAAGTFPAVALDSTWPSDGATVAVRTYPHGSLQTLPDGEGGLYLAWQDGRALDPASCNCRNMDDIYAQRLDAQGCRRWGAQDLAICTWRGMWGGPDTLAGLHPDGTGGAVVIWMHSDGPYGTYGQRVARDGSMMWGPEGATLYENVVGVKFTPRTARTGQGVWIGLDAAEETRVRLGAGTLASGELKRGAPFDVALPARFETVSLLPGPRADSCLVVMTTRSDGDACWAIPVSGRAAGPPRRLLEVADGRSPVRLLPDGNGGAWVAAIANAPPAAASGNGPPMEAWMPYAIRIQHADGKAAPRWGPGIAAAAVASPGTPFAIATSPRGDLAVIWPESGAPGQVAVRVLDRDGRSRWPAPVRLGDRAECTRGVGILAVPSGWLVCWTEWEAGTLESLRVALVPDDGDTPSPPGGLAILRRNGAVSLERLDAAPGGAFVFVYDMSTRALKAFRVRAD